PHCSATHRDLPSFPTRRSSDLSENFQKKGGPPFAKRTALSKPVLLIDQADYGCKNNNNFLRIGSTRLLNLARNSSFSFISNSALAKDNILFFLSDRREIPPASTIRVKTSQLLMGLVPDCLLLPAQDTVPATGNCALVAT